jgi:hypothetical protein
MSAPRQVPDKKCAECPTVKRPKGWAQHRNPEWCCSRSCASRRTFRLKSGPLMSAARKTLEHAQSRARVERAVRKKYGELSVREIELFNMGMKVGYDRGYSKAYKRWRTNAEAAA